MTAQNTHASISQNSFGTGAKINLVVGTSSKKNGKEKSETAAIILGLNDDDDTKFCGVPFTFVSYRLIKWRALCHLRFSQATSQGYDLFCNLNAN